jgi:hypothetical protein
MTPTARASAPSPSAWYVIDGRAMLTAPCVNVNEMTSRNSQRRADGRVPLTTQPEPAAVAVAAAEPAAVDESAAAAGATCTGKPLRTAVPESGSRSVPSRS